MVVDVLYEGLKVAEAAETREEAGGLFVPLGSPLPVGTRLLLRGPEGDRLVRVDKVHEGVGPGVLVRPLDARMAAQGPPPEASAATEFDRDSPTDPNALAPDTGESGEGGDGEKKGRKEKRKKGGKSAERH